MNLNFIILLVPSSFTQSSNNIYFEADAPSTSNDFSNQSQVSLNTYQPQRQGHRYYYR
jgi:hypothetical protein